MLLKEKCRHYEKKNVDKAVQTFVPYSEYVSPQVRASQPITFDDNVHNSWFFRPHTVTILCVSIFSIWILSKLLENNHNLRYNLTAGILSGMFLFLLFSALQLPDGILIRPAKIFWRLVKGLSVLYICFLVFLLFQNLDDVRVGLKLIDRNLENFEEKNYATDCRLYVPENNISHFPNFIDRLDVFVIAHLFGWFIKAIVIRDSKLLWFLSILFEWMEVSLRHVLPNFHECWWDHLILDIFGCNLLGIYIGMRFCRYFELKEYKWHATDNNDTESKSKYSNSAIECFIPYKWTEYKWPYFLANIESFVGLLIFTTCVTIFDLNVFFLKAEIRIPSNHVINCIRLFFWAFAAASGTREFYEYMTDKNNYRMGVQCWLDLAMVLCEFLLVIKWSDGIKLDNICPMWIKVAWTMIISLICFIGIWIYFRDKKYNLKESDLRTKSVLKYD